MSTFMTLADKIIDLRKKMGWSQEQLADWMGISRQSVSKWESGASVPELDKIIKMSELFGVTTDYLLKEEITEPGGRYAWEDNREDNAFEEKVQDKSSEDSQYAERKVSLEEAVTIMDLERDLSSRIAFGVSLCILSPIGVLLLATIAETTSLLSENMAGGIGCAILLLFVAAGAGQLISNGMKLDKYEFLEKENIQILPEVRKLVEEKKEEFAPAYRKSVVTGVLLCICGVLPILIAAAFDVEDYVYSCCVCLLLGTVAVGVYCFVRYGTIQEGFNKLLEEGDYTRDKKAVNKKIDVFAGIYWCIVVAIYMVVSFITNKWQLTWIVFPVAGVLFAACQGIMRMAHADKA